jgi:hypothetical protein
MAVIVYTSSPPALLEEIRAAIDENHVVTWTYDSDGDFTHATQQWRYLAWLRPRTQSDRLIFNTVTPTDQSLSSEAYAIYHGRFIEMLLAHFDEKFTSVTATAMPELPDLVEG